MKTWRKNSVYNYLWHQRCISVLMLDHSRRRQRYIGNGDNHWRSTFIIFPITIGHIIDPLATFLLDKSFVLARVPIIAARKVSISTIESSDDPPITFNLSKNMLNFRLRNWPVHLLDPCWWYFRCHHCLVHSKFHRLDTVASTDRQSNNSYFPEIQHFRIHESFHRHMHRQQLYPSAGNQCIPLYILKGYQICNLSQKRQKRSTNLRIVFRQFVFMTHWKVDLRHWPKTHFKG